MMITMRVSLDKRKNHKWFYFYLTPEVAVNTQGINISSSLHPDSSD